MATRDTHPHAPKEEDEAHIFLAVVQAEPAWPNAPSNREGFPRISKINLLCCSQICIAEPFSLL
jgi:hypothetical protein